MCVHGYPADMSIFCNLQLGLLKLQEDTPQADIDQDNVSLAGGAARCSWSHGLISPPRVRECHCWAIICGFLRRRVRSRDAVFPILQRLVDADFAAVEIFNGKTNYANHKLELTSHCMASDWQLEHCDTVCHSLLYGLHLQRAPK